MATTTEEKPAPPPPRPIYVIRKKKGGGHGAHGGAWKVAYADFVTAMMALFIVLWLMSSDKEVKEAVSAFFNNPTGPGKQTGTAAAGSGHSIEIPKDDMSKLKEKIQQALMALPDFRNLKDNVEMTITSDGLRIELLETDAGMFFESGRPAPTSSGSELLATLAQELGHLPNDILIEGHTDSKPFSDSGYSNWELSTDRANSARKLMESHGLHTAQVAQVRGYSDRQLRHPEDPASASNRRISVIVQYLSPAPGAPEKEKTEAKSPAPGASEKEKTEAKSPAPGAPEKEKPEAKSPPPGAPEKKKPAAK